MAAPTMQMSAAPNSIAAEEAQESLVDKLKGGEFSQVIDAACEDQAMKLDVHGEILRVSAARLAGDAARSHAERLRAEDELAALRRMRVAQMKKRADTMRCAHQQGRGILMRLRSDQDFLDEAKKHGKMLSVLFPCLDEGEMHSTPGVGIILSELRRLAAANGHVAVNYAQAKDVPLMFLTAEVGNLPACIVAEKGKILCSRPGKTALDVVRAVREAGGEVDCDSSAAESDDDDAVRKWGDDRYIMKRL